MANVGESSNPGAQVPIPVSATQVPTPAVTVPVNHPNKPEKFNGLNFKRWQQKMLFYLTTLNLARFLTEDPPQVNEEDRGSLMAFDVWKSSDYLCRNYVMNSLADALYNIYCVKKTAFLNGDLDEEIYMEQPEGFVAPGQEKKVCKLVKSLYGLKQAPKQWHQKFDNVVLANGFKINECDKCIYVKNTVNGYVILCLYVDDMLIVGSDDEMIKSTKAMLSTRFDMKDMGLADVILGVKILRTSDGLVLSQSHYVDKILDKFSNDDSGVARTPIDVNLHMSKNRGDSVSQLEYSRVIGSLMYLMSCTRLDIAYAVSKLSRYTSNPNGDHWKGIVRVLRYLRYTRDYGLHYIRYPAILEGYSDANWISDVKNSKSTSGYVFTLAGAAISWKSSKQTVIARSIMESEFIAFDKCGEEAEWLRNFLEDIPRWPKPVTAISINCDSQSAIGRAQNVMYNGKSRHIRRRHNTIRQLISTGVISVDYVKSKDNIADPLTKGLNRELVEKSSRGMGLKPIKMKSQYDGNPT